MYLSMFAGYLLRNRRRYWFGVWHDDNDRSGARRRVFFMIKFALLLLKSAKFHKKEKEEEKGERGKASNFLH